MHTHSHAAHMHMHTHLHTHARTHAHAHAHVHIHTLTCTIITVQTHTNDCANSHSNNAHGVPAKTYPFMGTIKYAQCSDRGLTTMTCDCASCMQMVGIIELHQKLVLCMLKQVSDVTQPPACITCHCGNCHRVSLHCAYFIAPIYA